MKNMNITHRVGMTLAAAVLISSLAFTQAADARPNRRGGAGGKGNFQQQDFRGGKRGGGRGAGFGFFLGDLSLSDEQKTQMQEKQREFQLASEETRLKMRYAQQDLRTAMSEDPVDQAKVDALWADIAELRTAQDAVRTNQLLELKSILTEEQLATLQAKESEMQELHVLKAEYRELLLASGEVDTAKLQELQAQITEKELVFEKERVEKRAAFHDDFAQSRGGRRGPKVFN